MTAKVQDFILPLAILTLATVAIALTGADLAVSRLFYINGAWPVGELQPWHLLYQLDRAPSIGLATLGLAAAVLGFINKKRRSWIRPGIFLVILLALGPGLIVNAVFKEGWGRPRPREIIQFGGSKPFLHPWQKGIAHQGRSFPSGHASAAFYMTAPFFIYRRRQPRVAQAWFIGGITFGILMSIARLAQGGHFLSDNLWAWGMVHLTAVALYYLLHPDQPGLPDASA